VTSSNVGDDDDDDDASLSTFEWAVTFQATASLADVTRFTSSNSSSTTLAAWADDVSTSLQSSSFSVQLATDLGINVVVLTASAVPGPNNRNTITAAPTLSMGPTPLPTSMPSMAPTNVTSAAPTASDYVTIEVALYMIASAPVNYERLQALKTVTATTIGVASLTLPGFSFSSTSMYGSFYQWAPNVMADGNISFFTVSHLRHTFCVPPPLS
jgi:hypothetical protein